MTDRPMEVGVVVPTKNSARTLEACLMSLRNQMVGCSSIVVVDNHSTDTTGEIARRVADRFVIAGPERSSQRNVGARLLDDVDVVGFIDSDMELDPTVVAEAVTLFGAGAGAVIVPEHTRGEGFFAKVRSFERAQYIGASRVEAARFFRTDLFRSVGGFDEGLTAGEDWDLALRVAAQGAVLRHTSGVIWHNEGVVRYFAHCRKKGSYAAGLQAFLAKHGEVGRALILDRPYLKRPWPLLRHPALAAGLITLKSGELVAVVVALARQRRGIRTRPT